MLRGKKKFLNKEQEIRQGKPLCLNKRLEQDFLKNYVAMTQLHSSGFSVNLRCKDIPIGLVYPLNIEN